MYDNRTAKRILVQRLWEMQGGKCCYSERPINPDGHDQAVEHFFPKSQFEWKRNEWANLLLACPHCNGRKSDKFPLVITAAEDNVDSGDVEQVIFLLEEHRAVPAVLDPSEHNEEPEQHLTYILDDDQPTLLGQVVPRNGSKRGAATIEITGIDSEVFLRDRFEHYSDVLWPIYLRMMRLLRALRQGLGSETALRQAVKDYVDKMEYNERYAGFARELARVKRMNKNFGAYGFVIPA